MTKKELLKVLKDAPDDAEIRIGNVFDGWTNNISTVSIFENEVILSNASVFDSIRDAFYTDIEDDEFAENFQVLYEAEPADEDDYEEEAPKEPLRKMKKDID